MDDKEFERLYWQMGRRKLKQFWPILVLGVLMLFALPCCCGLLALGGAASSLP